MNKSMIDKLHEELEEQHLPCEWRLEWHKPFHTVEIVLLLEVSYPPDNSISDIFGHSNHEDRFIFEDSVLFYDRASSKIKTEEYLTGIPFDRKKGIQGGLAEAVVKNIRLTVGEANTKLRDFLKGEGESSFELHWNELNFMQTIETLKELGRFDETYYRYP